MIVASKAKLRGVASPKWYVDSVSDAISPAQTYSADGMQRTAMQRTSRLKYG